MPVPTPALTSNAFQGLTGLGVFLAVALHSALLFEADGDSVGGVGRVLLAALFYSLILTHILKGFATPDSALMSRWISVLVLDQIVYVAVVLAAVFTDALPALAAVWVNLLGLALLVGHLTVLILRSQRAVAKA